MFTQPNSGNANNNPKRIVVEETLDYGRFSRMIGNRPINKVTLGQVLAEIRNEGQIVPIMCNEKYQVCDGQHRLEACKKLGIPVMYIRVPGMTIKDAAAANAAGKNWSTRDWINYHAELGNENYKKLYSWIDYCSNLGIPTTPAIMIARGTAAQNSFYHLSDGTISSDKAKRGIKRLGYAGNDIRLGFWKTRDYEKSMKILNSVLLFRDFDFHKNTYFITALMSCLRDEDFDPKRLAEQAKKHPKMFYHCGKTIHFMEMFETIYNYGRNKKNRLPLVNNPKTCL